AGKADGACAPKPPVRYSVWQTEQAALTFSIAAFKAVPLPALVAASIESVAARKSSLSWLHRLAFAAWAGWYIRAASGSTRFTRAARWSSGSNFLIASLLIGGALPSLFSRASMPSRGPLGLNTLNPLRLLGL